MQQVRSYMSNRHKKYIPSKKNNPALQAKRIDELQKRVENSAVEMDRILDIIQTSYSRHLELLANFTGHNMGNAIQTMYASLVKYDESEEWVKEIKGAIETLNGVLDSFKHVISYNDSDGFTIPKLAKALDILIRSSCYMEKISVNFVYNREDKTLLNFSYQYMLQVLHNLVTNSIKALGHISSNRQIEIEMYTEDANCFFIVKDNGIGIAVDNIDKIFKYKYTTTEGGSGIGLYFVKYIIEDMYKGKITVEQDKDSYTTIFNLKIPCNND